MMTDDPLSPLGGGIATFERTLIQARVVQARKAGKRLGRPTVGIEKEAALKAALTSGDKGILKIATEHKVGSSVVQRIKRELVEIA